MEGHLEGAWHDLEVQLQNCERKLDMIIKRLHAIDLKLDWMCADLKADFAEIKVSLLEQLEASRRHRG